MDPVYRSRENRDVHRVMWMEAQQRKDLELPGLGTPEVLISTFPAFNPPSDFLVYNKPTFT